MATTPVVQPHHLSAKPLRTVGNPPGPRCSNIESTSSNTPFVSMPTTFGWPEERIEVVETDMGRTAQTPRAPRRL